MHIYLASSTHEIISFAKEGLRNSPFTLVPVDSAQDLAKHLSQPAPSATVMLDMNFLHAHEAVEQLNETARRSQPVPLALLTDSKHPMPQEPAVPPHAVRIRKPFCIASLELGASLAGRAAKGLPHEMLEAGDIRLVPATGAAYRQGRALRPHPREALLLEAFMRAPGQILSRETILSKFFDYTAHPRPNLVDVLACRLRSRLHGGFGKPVLFTVRGSGYVFRP